MAAGDDNWDDHDDHDFEDTPAPGTATATPEPPSPPAAPEKKPARKRPPKSAAAPQPRPATAPVDPPDWEARAHAMAHELSAAEGGQAQAEIPQAQRGFFPQRPKVRPLDMRRNLDRNYLEVYRQKCSSDVDEDEVGIGWCGTVRDQVGFQSEIARRWGGGTYQVLGLYEGKPREDVVDLAGTSKPNHADADDEDERPVFRSPASMPSPAGGPYQPRPPVTFPPYGQSYPPQAPGYPPYGQPPYGQPFYPPYGPPPYGQPPYGQAPYPVAPAAGAAPYTDARSKDMENKLEQLQAALIEARNEAATEREERRVEQERAKAEKEALRQQSELEGVRAELRQLSQAMQNGGAKKGESALDRMLEIQLAKISQDQLQLEKDRAERQAEADRQASLAQQRADSDRTHRLEERKLEDAKAASERERQDKYMKLIADTLKGNQADPLALIEKLNGLNPKKDWQAEIKGFAAVATALRDLFDKGGGGGDPEESKIAQVIKNTGDALAGAIQAWRSGAGEQPGAQADPAVVMAMQQGQLGGPPPVVLVMGPGGQPYTQTGQPATLQQVQAFNAWQAGRAQAMQQRQLVAQQQQAQAQQQALQLPYRPAAGTPGPAVPPAAMAQGQQQAQPAVSRDPTAEEWGQILDWTLTQYGQGDAPPDVDEVAPQLYAFAVHGMGLPAAVGALCKATPTMIRWRAQAARREVDAASPYAEKIGLFLDMLDDEDGAGWVEDLLDALREHEVTVRQAAPTPPPMPAAATQPIVAPPHATGPAVPAAARVPVAPPVNPALQQLQAARFAAYQNAVMLGMHPVLAAQRFLGVAPPPGPVDPNVAAMELQKLEAEAKRAQEAAQALQAPPATPPVPAQG